MGSYLKVELLHSAIARDQRQKDTLRGLGLRHRHQQRILKDTPAIRGMIQKVFDLIRWEKSSSEKLAVAPKVETYRLGAVEAAPREKPKATHKVSEARKEAEKPAAKKVAKAKKTDHAHHPVKKASHPKTGTKKKKD